MTFFKRRDEYKIITNTSDDEKNYEIVRLIVNKYPSLLKHVPKNLMTEELCKMVVKKSGVSLEHVPIDMRTKEICTLAVGDTGYALCYVPAHLRTRELCHLAVKVSYRAFEILDENEMTEDICCCYVMKKKNRLYGIPEKMLFRYSKILKHIKIKYRDFPFCFQVKYTKREANLYINIILFIKN